ncbi:MAG: hypothetical protein ISP88_15230 [Pseudomonadales bacterium]|nr:hypothetical protein [Pseudomonadales bacterium]MBL6816721.1 hypothetical protein [Pseudomonadales bacterium]
MQVFNEAWEIVSDRFIREKYDEAIGDKKSESDAFDETSQIEDEDEPTKDYFEKDWNLLFPTIPIWQSMLVEQARFLGDLRLPR